MGKESISTPTHEEYEYKLDFENKKSEVEVLK